jgi:cobalt/nickel transport protein
MPWPGWWGFAALHTDEDRQIEKDGKKKPVEVGGVIWVYANQPLK